MTEEEIIEEAKKRAKEDAIKVFGDLVATKEARLRLNFFDNQNLVEFLKQRARHWVNRITPQVIGVKVDGVDLEKIDEEFTINYTFI